MTTEQTSASCRCGKVKLELVGPPIFRGICYCGSCQEAGRRYQGGPGVDLATDGGTDYLLYRKDRIRCVAGGETLEERRLKPESPTRRLYATCCDTAMALDFTKGHWLTVYRSRVASDVPPPALRLMTASRPEGVRLPDDGIPDYPGHSGKFVLKLMAAWAAMGFRRSRVAGFA